jgi:hypothetical protein
MLHWVALKQKVMGGFIFVRIGLGRLYNAAGTKLYHFSQKMVRYT